MRKWLLIRAKSPLTLQKITDDRFWSSFNFFLTPLNLVLYHDSKQQNKLKTTMKTRKSVVSFKDVSAVVAAVLVVLASCQKDSNILTAADTQNVNAESASSAYFNEGSDISTIAIGGISATQYAGARTENNIAALLVSLDERFKCATVTMTYTSTSTKDNPSGIITITFDPNCLDNHGVRRSGTIIIDYSGKRWMPGSYFSVHDNFYRNDVHIEGVDSVITKVSADSTSLGYLQFESILNGKVTFGDGHTITRHHDLTREWFRATLPVNDEWHTLKGGEAFGTCRNGTYIMHITKDLVHKVACRAERVFIPVSGTKVITVTNSSNETRQYTINYGDGACDNEITVTINNKEKSIIVNGEGD